MSGSASGITRRRLSLVSLFSGAGGLDLGFEAAGFETRLAVEIEKNSRETLRRNRPRWLQPDDGDVLKLSGDELLKLTHLKTGELDVLIGGPPCQPFSKSAFWSTGSTRRLADPRARTLEVMIDLVEALQPRAVVIENVRGIAYREKDEGLKFIERRLSEINQRHGTLYAVNIEYLHATDFGVPQVRERAFMVLYRDGQKFISPQAITGEANLIPVPTAWDAIGGMALDEEKLSTLRPRGKWADLLSSIPEGSNYLWHTDRGDGLPLFGWRTRYWSFLLKLAKNKPAWTIQADPGPATGPFHWDSRVLAIEEMARLQTFPNDYVFAGDYRAARRQIGNAVPPALAEAVGKRVAATLLDAEYHPELTLAVVAGGPAPFETPATKVPERYHHLVGSHTAHPGTGKGPAAVRRTPVARLLPEGRGEDPDGETVDLGGEERTAA
ncbi:DNA cytosine methyltransferase [Rhizobium ruizarguesonis]